MAKFRKTTYLLIALILITTVMGCKNNSKPSGNNNSGDHTGGNDYGIGVVLPQASYYNEDFTTNYDNWELVNGATAEVTDGVLFVTPGTEGIALKLKETVWQSIVEQMGGSANNYYVEMLFRPTSTLSGNKNIGIATNISADNSQWYYAGINSNGRMQAGESANLKGYQNSGDGTTLKGEEDFIYYKWRYEYNNGVINFYCNDLFMGKNEQIANYNPGKNYTGSIGIYTCAGSFEVASVRIGKLDENQTKLIVQTNDASLPLLWGKYVRHIKASSTLGIRVGDTVNFTIEATDANGLADTWNATSSNPAVLTVSTANGVSGETLSITGAEVGTATIKLTNGSDANSTRELTYAVEEALGFVADNYGEIDGLVYPNVGATTAYTDGEIVITFDSQPEILDITGEIYINNYETDATVDTIYLSNDKSYYASRKMELDEGSQRVRIDGNKLYITPHFSNLAYDTKFYVAMANEVISGTLNGKPFTGFSPENKTWYFTTKSAPSINSNIITVDGSQTSTADFRTVQAALTYAENNRLDNVEIQIQPGIYRELLSYFNDSNITLRGMGTAKYGSDVVIEYKNGDKLNSGSSYRCLAYFATNQTINLVNLTIKNAADKASYGQAEAIYFNRDGHLIANNCSFISEQDTIQTKGVNWFYDCYIAGNTDFVWGSATACVFEQCEIHCISDGSLIFQARCPAGSRGYVLLNCDLITDTAGESFFARSGGSMDYYDHVSVINCRTSGVGTLKGWYEDPKPNPNPGTATSGWKQYGLTDEAGNPITVTSPTSYTLTTEEYNHPTNGWDTSAKIFGKDLVLP